jgi:hypothetical protein
MLVYQLINQHFNAIRQLRDLGKDLEAAESVLQELLDWYMPIGTKVGFTSLYRRLYLAWGPYSAAVDIMDDGVEVYEGRKVGDQYDLDDPTLPTIKAIFTEVFMRKVI